MAIFGLGMPVVLIGIVWALTAPRPRHPGIQEGRLPAVPDTPNCVATQSGNPHQRMAPIPYVGNPQEVQKQVMDVLMAMPRMEIVKNEPGYIYVVFRSWFFRFPDDVEFLFDDANKVIHFRAAARLGWSDFGVNRKRMEEIGKAFQIFI